MSRCSQECLTVDPPEPTQAEASHAMPILPFRKQGFDPDLALAQRLFVALQVLIRTNPLQYRLLNTAAQAASLWIGGTLGG